MNESFVEFVIDVIESAGSGDHGEELVDTLVPLILAFNQHFVGNEYNYNIMVPVIFSQIVKVRLSLLLQGCNQ